MKQRTSTNTQVKKLLRNLEACTKSERWRTPGHLQPSENVIEAAKDFCCKLPAVLGEDPSYFLEAMCEGTIKFSVYYPYRGMILHAICSGEDKWHTYKVSGHGRIAPQFDLTADEALEQLEILSV